MEGFSLLTLNCQGGYREELPAFLASILQRKEHDFILLQHANSAVRDALAQAGMERHGYGIMHAENPDTGELANECVIFRAEYTLASTEFLSFAQFRRTEDKGAIAGVFTIPGCDRRMIVCSAHLHSREHPLVRRKEAKELKRFLMGLDGTGGAVKVVGGDFNNMFFKELQLMVRYLQPEFRHCTIYETHSHDTTHLEEFSFLSKLFVFLGRNGLKMRTKLDHIFVDSESAAGFSFDAKAYEVLVSDHKPVELRMRKRSQKGPDESRID